MIIGIPIPHNYSMPWDTVKSLLALEGKYLITYVEGPYIYMNRNELINRARVANDSLLMIDSDMVFSPDDVGKIEENMLKYKAVTGVYVNTRPPNPPMIFKRVEGDYEVTEPPQQIAQIGACGGGFLALSKDLIQKLPYECCNNIKEGEVEHGEDISLCHRINLLGEKIMCNPDINLGQVRTNIIYAS